MTTQETRIRIPLKCAMCIIGYEHCYTPKYLRMVTGCTLEQIAACNVSKKALQVSSGFAHGKVSAFPAGADC